MRGLIFLWHLVNPFICQPKQKWKWKSCSFVWFFATPWTKESMEFPDQTTGVGSLSILQGIFPTQELNPGLLNCRWILYRLIHKGSLNKSKQATRQILTRTKWSVLTHAMTHFLVAIWRLLRGCCCDLNYAYLAQLARHG